MALAGKHAGKTPGLFARKPVGAMLADVNDADSHGSHLQRTLGLRNLVGFGVGSAVGVSLFVQTGPEAALHAGPAVALSFVLASFACLLAALCYAEFAGLVPVAGSAYSYAYATMGEGVAWLIGWCLLLEYLMSGSLVAIGWSGYATATLHSFGFDLPEAITGAPLAVVSGHVVRSGKIVDLPAVLITLFTAFLIMRGTRLSARVNDVVVALKVIAILAVIAGAAPFIHVHNWVPFVPPNTGVTGSFGVSGVMRAAGILFFAYVGFDSISTLGQETRNPQRTIPLALMISLAICVVLYVGVALVMTGIADYRTLNVADPIAEAMRAQGPRLAWARWCVSVVAIFGLVSVLLVTLLGQVRIFYAMGRDGLLPPAFARIHPTLLHALCRHHRDRDRRRPVCRAVPARPAGRPRLHRHAARVRRGLRRRADPAAHDARPAARLPHPVHAVHPHPGGPGLYRPDVFAVGRYLGQAGAMARARRHRLCRLWLQALQAARRLNAQMVSQG